MTDQEKDKKIGALKKSLDAAKKRIKKLQQEQASADTTIYKLENDLNGQSTQIFDLRTSIEHLKRAADMLKEIKPEVRPNDVFTERLKRQHVVLLQLAAFAEGVMLAELVDNPSENLGYEMGRDRLRSFITASELIVLEK